MVGAYDAEVANEAVVALDEDTAQLLVPNTDPVIPAVILNDPVISVFPMTRNSVTALLDSKSDPVIT